MTIEEYKDILLNMLGDLRTECEGVRCTDCPLLGQCMQKTQEKAQRLIYTKPLKYEQEDAYCDIETLEGIMRANTGDYIIRGVNGEIYPCKSDIF